MAAPAAHAAAGGAHVVKASDFRAVGDGQADDTAAIQRAINEAYALASNGSGYARVEFDAKVYQLASQPVRPVPGQFHPAGQLMIPLRTSGPMITIELAGAGVQTGLQFIYGGPQAPAGTMLKSTVTTTWAGHGEGQAPAVIASPKGNEWGGFNWVSVAVTNLAIQVPSNPTVECCPILISQVDWEAGPVAAPSGDRFRIDLLDVEEVNGFDARLNWTRHQVHINDPGNKYRGWIWMACSGREYLNIPLTLNGAQNLQIHEIQDS